VKTRNFAIAQSGAYILPFRRTAVWLRTYLKNNLLVLESNFETFDIWGSHSCNYIGGCVLKMEAAGTPETSVNFYYTTRRINPEASHFQHRNLFEVSP
jgi:hypothetical protein